MYSFMKETKLCICAFYIVLLGVKSENYNFIKEIKHVLCGFIGRVWLAQFVRSLPSDYKVPGSIPGFAEIRIFVQPSFPPKPTQPFPSFRGR